MSTIQSASAATAPPPSIRLTVNGDGRTVAAGTSVAQLVVALGLDGRKVAVERNREIVSRSHYGTTVLGEGDAVEIVHFIGGGLPDDAVADSDPLVVGGLRFRSRLLVGTGKYKDFEQTARAIEASGAEIVTVAVRRVNLTDPGKPMMVDYVDPKRYTYLPNTAGCYTADDAIRTARLGREVGLSEWVKLEVIGDELTLFPDNDGLLEA
ncbi:MAG: sulfur carrier protein ThiS, partial [Proteobacteria bacterium]|nr:sulfur carrier protein ThiS [Pseudomonadota bacterium]